jgi:hypothetical protein
MFFVKFSNSLFFVLLRKLSKKKTKYVTFEEIFYGIFTIWSEKNEDEKLREKNDISFANFWELSPKKAYV